MTNDYKFAAYPSEKEIAKRVSNNLFEEVYTDLDIDRNIRTNADRGYHFDFPSLWLSEFGPHKAIAPRRLQVIPSLHIRSFGIVVRDGSNEVTSPLLTYNIIEETSFEEWISRFSSDILELTGFFVAYTYRFHTGYFKLQIYKRDNESARVILPFRFQYVDPANDPGPILQFLNQEVLYPNIQILNVESTEKVFEGVWNRKRLFFHANFSTNNRNYLGMSGDTWSIPNKIFKYNSGMSNFNIWMTTNGQHRILLLHVTFIMELSFIVNQKTVKINH